MGPLLADVLVSQIDQLLQCHVGGKCAFSLGKFPDLPMGSFDGVGRVDQRANSRIIFEVGVSKAHSSFNTAEGFNVAALSDR